MSDDSLRAYVPKEQEGTYVESSSQQSRLGRKMLSVVTPAHNEAPNLEEFYKQVSAQLSTLPYDWEILFVDDGSQDETQLVLDRLVAEDSHIRALSFSRNFGKQEALTAGLRSAAGDAVIIMDSDLQHPPEVIPQLVAQWEKGFRIVRTVRRYGKSIPWHKRLTSRIFYPMMNRLFGVYVEPGAPEFELFDRCIVDIINQLTEQTRFFSALIPWLGFKQTTIPFDCHDRFAGTPSFTSLKLLELTIDAITSFSTKPLRWISYLGLGVMIVTVPYGLWGLFNHFILNRAEPGWTSIITINILIGGAILFSLGIIGEYIGRIYNEVRHRPIYIVEKSWGKRAPNQEKEFFSEEVSEPREITEVFPYEEKKAA